MQTYWEKRAEESVLRMEDTVQNKLPELVHSFEMSRQKIEEEIFKFYGRYAVNNKISLVQAQSLLTSNELFKWKRSLEEFRALAKSSIGSYNLQLENWSLEARVSRLQALQFDIESSLQRLYQEQKNNISGAISEIYQDEYYHAQYDLSKFTGNLFSFAKVPTEVLEQLACHPVFGADLSTRLWRQDIDIGFKIRESLNRMFTEGRPPQDFAEELGKLIGAIRQDESGKTKGSGKKYEAYRVLYNEASFASGQADLDVYAHSGTEYYQLVATLDLLTSEKCRCLDGCIFSVKNGGAVPEKYRRSSNQYQLEAYSTKSPVAGINMKPLHVNCRCAIAPIVEGLEGLDEARTARDPATGKSSQVPYMEYPEWYEKYVKGDAVAELAEEKTKNASNDFTQYQKYREILKENAPKGFAEFLDLKYNKSAEFKLLRSKYSDQKLRNRLASDIQPKIIDLGKQGKHIRGHNNYISGKSYLTISLEQAQELVRQYAGSGEIIRDKKENFSNKELVTSNLTVGYSVNTTTLEETATRKFYIHYSKTGVHIVPTIKNGG